MPNDRNRHAGLETFAAGQGGTLASATQAAQTDAISEGLRLMVDAATRLADKSPEILKGDLFEYIERAKFNTNAAALDPSLVAELTRELGDPAAAADILIRQRGGPVLEQVQAKAGHSVENMTGYLRDPKYSGMQKLVPSDKVDGVQARAEFRANYWEKRGNVDYARENADTARNVTGELHHGKVRSGGTTLQETKDAALNPTKYRFNVETLYVLVEGVRAGGSAFVAGSVIGGAISVAKNGMRVAKGDMAVGEAAREVAKDAGSAGARGFATGTLGTAVRYGGVRFGGRFGGRVLAKSNVAMALAASVVETGVTVYKLICKEITAEQAALQIGQNGCSTLSGIFAGAAAGAVFGPVGIAIGSIAGYMIAAQVFQGSVSILRSARLAEAEAQRLEELCMEAIAAIEAMREEVERSVDALTRGRQESFSRCLAVIDDGLLGGSAVKVIAGLTDLAEAYGIALKLATFEEFDDFMCNSSEPLRF